MGGGAFTLTGKPIEIDFARAPRGPRLVIPGPLSRRVLVEPSVRRVAVGPRESRRVAVPALERELSVEL